MAKKKDANLELEAMRREINIRTAQAESTKNPRILKQLWMRLKSLFYQEEEVVREKRKDLIGEERARIRAERQRLAREGHKVNLEQKKLTFASK